MTDKTRLEMELDQHERLRTPVGVKVLIIVLMIVLAGVTSYTFKLERELKSREAEITELKDNFQKEKIELLSRFKRFQMESSDTESPSDSMKE